MKLDFFSFSKLCLLVLVWISADARAVPNDEQAASAPTSRSEQEKVRDLVLQLGAESHAQRREAFSRLLRLGAVAKEEVELAATSSNRQIAETAARLKTLIRVVSKCQDPQVALEVADVFLDPDEKNLSKLSERGLWDLAELFLDEHGSVEIRCQEEFFQDQSVWYLVQRLVDHAEQQGNAELAWPVIARLVPVELACWTANKLNLPVIKQPEDDHERALHLFYSGKIDESLKQNIPAQLKFRLALRGFRWEQFSKKELQEALLGVQESSESGAANAILAEVAGDENRADLQWREALSISEDVVSFSEKESQAALKALEDLSPIDEPNERKLVQKSPSHLQLIVALMLSGRTEAVGRYLAKDSPQAAFVFRVREDYAKAFECLGLNADLGNFDKWVKNQKRLAVDRLTEFERSRESFKRSPELVSMFLPATNLGHVASILASVGKREQALKILAELLILSQKFPSDSDVWNRCILRWLHSDQWRELCIEVVSNQFDSIPKDQQSLVLEKLFPHLGTNAWAFLAEAPGVKNSDQPPSWPVGFEQLVHLERCDRDFFGPSASNVVRAWIRRVAQQGGRGGPEDAEEEFSFKESNSLLQLAKLANDWEDSTLAMELLGIDENKLIPDFDSYLLIAKICLKSKQFDAALQYIEAAPNGPRNQHWKSLIRVESLLTSGRIQQAEQQVKSNWMRMSSLNWNGDPSAGLRAVEDLTEEKRWEEALEYAERNFAVERAMSYTAFWQARQYSLILEELEQHAASADVMRGVFLELLRPNSIVIRIFAANNDLDLIRSMVGRERMSRAISLIEKKEFEASRRELDVAYRVLSQDIEPAVSCYPRLVKAGQLNFAEQLLGQYESALNEQIRQWPDDAMSLNNLAWMYAKCDVKLDKALELSRKAIALVPSSAVYLDTLAEIHYRRGEVDLAIETMRNCVRLDPRAKGYRNNLVRFSTGKP